MKPSNLAHEVKRRMDAAGLTQRSLATSAGLKETYVRDILIGKSKSPTVENLAKLSLVLGCSLDDLFWGNIPDDSKFAILPENGGNPPYSEKERAVIELWRALLSRQQEGLICILEGIVRR